MSETIYGIINAAVILIGSIVLALFSRWILRKTLRNIYSKTRSKIDDVIVLALVRPLTMAIITIGVYGAALILINLDAWNLPAGKIINYTNKANQILKAVFTIIAALAALNIFNGIGRWYMKSADSRGVATQVEILKKLINIGIWGLMIALTLSQLGYKISALLATLGVAGLAVALALQDTLANIFSGFYIVADKSVKAGDYVKLDSGEEGFVEEVGWRNTRIRLWANNMVIVPNSKLIQSTLTNYEMPQSQLSVYIPCGVSYNCDLDHVEKVTVDVATEVLQTVPGGVQDYEPVVRFK